MTKRLQRTNWLLALHWTSDTVHFVLTRRRGQQLEVVAADSHVLEDGVTIDGLVAHLKTELARHGAKRPVLLVALSRSYVDVLPLMLPSAADGELPALVELQVMQQLPDAGENAVIDFITTDHRQSEERKVLAFVLRAGTMDFVKAVSAGIKAKHRVITVRTLATLSLYRRTALSTSDTSVVVTPLAEEADVAIFRRGVLESIRTVHLGSGQDSQYAAELANEIQRTLLLTPAHDGEDDAADEQVVAVLSDPSDDKELLDELTGSLSTPVQALQPFRVLDAANASRAPVGTYAPLLGLTDQYVNSTVKLNFLDPRRPLPPPSPARKYAAYGIAATLLLGAAIYYVYQARAGVNQQINDLRGQLGRTNKTVAKLESRRLVVAAVQQWEANAVNWLDEIRDISLRFPQPNDAFTQRLTVSGGSRGDSVVSLQVRVQDPAIVGIMEANLRDDHHRVLSKRVAERSEDEDFGWQFETTIFLQPREPADYLPYLELEPDRTVDSNADVASEAAPPAGSEAASDATPATTEQP